MYPALSDESPELQLGPYGLDFDAADAYCKTQGMELASVHDQEQRDAVRELCLTQAHSCWIGLYLDDDAATWTWTDGSALDYGFDGGSATRGVDPWWKGEPNNRGGVEDCVHLYSGQARTWNVCT